MPLTYLPRKPETAEAHQIKIVDNVVPSYPSVGAKGTGASSYALRVVCSCQWEALAQTQQDAEYYAESHRRSHGIWPTPSSS